MTQAHNAVGLFQASDLTEPRYVWDPMVHKSLGEHCFFAYLRLRDQRRDVVRKIHTMATDVGIRSICIYSTFGHYDILIRMWTTRERLDLLEPGLEQLASENTSVEIVHVHKVFYSDWAHHRESIDTRYVEAYEPKIKVLTSMAVQASPAEVTSALDDLKKAQLVHLLDPSEVGIEKNDSVIKTYVALIRRSEAEGNRERELDIVRNIVSGLAKLKLKSIYWAKDSRTPFLVKAVVRAADFGDLDSELDRLELALREHQILMRMTTFIVANLDAPERDVVVTDLPETSGIQWDRLTREMDRDARRALQLVPQGYLDGMYELYRRHSNAGIYRPFEPHFNSVLAALAMRNVGQLQRAVGFTASIEHNLLRWLRSFLLPSVLGTKWYQRLQTVLETIDPEQSFTDAIPLKPLLEAVNWLVQHGDIPVEAVEAVLGVGWYECLKNVHPLRNAVAHGGLEVNWAAGSREGEKSWFVVADRGLALGGVYNGLSSALESEELS